MQKLICEKSSYNKLPSTWPPKDRGKFITGTLLATKEELDLCRIRIESDNRNAKIESILEDKEFVEKKLDEDEEYISLCKRGIYPVKYKTSRQTSYVDIVYVDYITGIFSGSYKSK